MIGVAIPSRGRPAELKRAMDSLIGRSTEKIHIAVRMDFDDPELRNPLLAGICRMDDKAIVSCKVGNRMRGYVDNHVFIDEAAKILSTDCDLMMQFVDDAEMRTDRWNEKYREAIGDRQIFVCSANVTTPDGSNYPWSFPLIPRRLYEINGGFCLGSNPSVDRCWAAFARAYSCEVRSGVDVIHHHIGAIGAGDKTSQEGRTPFARNIPDRVAWETEHDRIGREFAEKVRAACA